MDKPCNDTILRGLTTAPRYCLVDASNRLWQDPALGYGRDGDCDHITDQMDSVRT